MKIISVRCAEESVEAKTGVTLVGRIGPDSLAIGIQREGVSFVLFQVRFAGAVLTTLDTERNMGGAAAGAIIGELLLGPLGALAGAARGAKRTYTMVLKSPDACVVFEVEKAAFQRLAGLGLPSMGDVRIERPTLPKGEPKKAGGTLLSLAVGLVLFFFVIAIVRASNSHSQEPTSTPAPVTAVAAPAPAPAAPATPPVRTASVKPKPKAKTKPKAEPKPEGVAPAQPKSSLAVASASQPAKPELSASPY